MRRLTVLIFISIVYCFSVVFFVKAEDAPVSETPVNSDKQETVQLVNPISGTQSKPEGENSVPVLVGGVINMALGVMGALVLLMLVWGAIGYIMAAGNPEKIKSSTKTIIWAAIGTLVVLASYILLNGILGALQG